MAERETWRLTAWLLGGVLGSAAIRIAFSSSGIATANIVLRRLGARAVALSAYGVWLLLALAVAGMAVTAVTCYATVRHSGAPSQLWLGAVVVSVMQVGSLAFTVAGVALMGTDLAAPAEVTDRLLSAVPYASSRVYVLAAIGYPAAAFVGCLLGSRKSKEPVLSGQPSHA